MTRANVTTLACRVQRARIGIPTSRKAELDQDPESVVWGSCERDADHLKRWLDAHAPGWTSEAEITGYATRELRIGGESAGELTLLWVTHWLVFARAEHARAYRRMVTDETARRSSRAHLLPAGEIGCEECGGPTTRRRRSEFFRVGLVEVAYTADLPWCAGCEDDAGVLVEGDDEQVWRQLEISKLIAEATDLPPDAPEESGPAVLCLACTAETPDEAVLDALRDAGLLARIPDVSRWKDVHA